MVTPEQGDPSAETWITESLALFREIGDRWGIALALNHLGEVARLRRDYAHAAVCYEESLALFREIGDKDLIAITLYNSGCAILSRGDVWLAATRFAESLTLSRNLGNKRSIAYCLEGLAAVAGTSGELERAARLYGAAQALREAIGARIDPADRVEYDSNVAAVRARLDNLTFVTAWEVGRATPFDQAINDAIRPMSACDVQMFIP